MKVYRIDGDKLRLIAVGRSYEHAKKLMAQLRACLGGSYVIQP